jgi:hypothetical protein
MHTLHPDTVRQITRPSTFHVRQNLTQAILSRLTDLHDDVYWETNSDRMAISTGVTNQLRVGRRRVTVGWKSSR